MSSPSHRRDEQPGAANRPPGAATTDWIPPVVLLAFTLLTRLPYFTVSVINWDESTFAILGQDLLDGHLPYTHLWDNKPPLVYVLFALFIGTFGRSITALRIGGVLCVWAASSILYVGVARLWGRAAGWTAALVVIVGCATLPSGQATMTEHLALVPLSVVLIGLLKGGLDRGRILALGGVAGLVTLIKADTASLAIAATIIVALDHEGRWPARKARVALFAAGVCLPFLATVATYAASGHVGILRTTFLDASFAYVTQTSVPGGRWSIIELIWTGLLSPQAIPGALAVGGIILIFGHGGEARLGAVRTDYELDQAISGVLIFRRADLPPDGPVLRGAPRP